MEWLNDPWVIGIGGGILSGIIVTGVSRWIFSGRDRNEHLSKVGSANREVVYAIRQGIPEDRVPTLGIVEALISSTARKYGLPPSDLNPPQDVASDLVKEVMDSSFISAEKKDHYCKELLAKMTPKYAEDELKRPEVIRVRNMFEEQRSGLIWIMSGTLGLTAAGMSAVLPILFRITDTVLLQPAVLFFPAAIALCAALIAVVSAQVRVSRRRAEQVSRMTQMLNKQNKDTLRDILDDASRVIATPPHSDQSKHNPNS